MHNAPSPFSSRPLWFAGLGWLLFVAIAAWWISGAQGLRFVDTNDFQRVVGHLYLTPLGDGLRWLLPERAFRMPGNPEIASHIFTLAGAVQRYLPGGIFDLGRTAMVAQMGLVLCAAVLAWQCVPGRQVNGGVRAAVGLAWLAVFFMAHNIGMAQSFYAEYAFLLAAPLLLIAVLAQGQRTQRVCMGIGALVCGLAKVQYFYLPLLALLVMALSAWWQRTPVDKRLCQWLVVVQVVCLVPLLIGKNAALNAHHGLYLGSYMVLDASQLDALGVPAGDRHCIGVDAWGNGLSGPGGTRVQPGQPSCYPEVPKLSKRDVLRPYMHDPQALPRLAQFALPSHFTVHYFHVFPGNYYLQRTDGGARAATTFLLRMTDARERWITPFAGLWLLAAMALWGWSRRSGDLVQRRMAAAGLLWALFVVSQVVVALLGEGLRDLSKHLWAAQWALDVLVLLAVLQLAVGLRQWWSARRSRAQGASGSGPTGGALKPQG